jgi:hypothetical protein
MYILNKVTDIGLFDGSMKLCNGVTTKTFKHEAKNTPPYAAEKSFKKIKTT